MNINLTLSLVLFLFYTASADLLFEGDNCTVPETNVSGICTNINQCNHARRMLEQKKNPKFCGFERKTPLVCCPRGENLKTFKAGALSRKMCDQYYDEKRSTELGVDMGTEALSKEFPHMAAVGYVENETSAILWYCGGSLISHYYVLSAAHCVNSLEYGLAKWIRLGDLDLQNTTEDANPRDLRIRQYLVHPLYKSFSHYHDIALFRFSNRIEFGSYFNPACLHTEKQLPVDTLQATGWGKLGMFGERSNRLMKVSLKVVDHGTCKDRYEGSSARRLKSGIVDEYQLCAGDASGKDTCPGDSGGPLHYTANTSGWIQEHFVVAGVTSFGKGCGGADTVGVYVRVSSYVEWIEKIVWSEEFLQSDSFHLEE